MKLKSKALEVNLADYHVDVTIDAKYSILQEVMSKYYGLMEGLNTFLKELSHPYKNWRFITTEARKYSLEYFRLLKNHPEGPAAANLLLEILFQTLHESKDEEVKRDTADNILLFIKKTTADSGLEFHKFQPVVNDAFNRICSLPDSLFSLFVKSYYGINRLAQTYLNSAPGSDSNYSSPNQLLVKYFNYTYSYWLKEKDPQTWFEKEAEIANSGTLFNEYFKAISHHQLKQWQGQLELLSENQQIESKIVLTELLGLPGFGQIVETYRRTPLQLMRNFEDKGRGHHLKLIFLFHIMNIAGLSLIHKETLREINRTLTWIIENENYRNIENLIRKTFTILKDQTRRYPGTALNCVLNMGKAVYNTDELDLVNYFIDAVIDLGFQTPMLRGWTMNGRLKSTRRISSISEPGLN